jgi:hypothetical protein
MEDPFLLIQDPFAVAPLPLEVPAQDPFAHILRQLDNLIHDLPNVDPQPFPPHRFRQHSVDIYGNQLVIYGDEGYAQQGQVLSPFRAQRITPEQGQFNEGMRRPRQCVEWGFGSIANH